MRAAKWWRRPVPIPYEGRDKQEESISLQLRMVAACNGTKRCEKIFLAMIRSVCTYALSWVLKR